MMTYFAMFKEIHLLRVHVLVHVRSRTPNLYFIKGYTIVYLYCDVQNFSNVCLAAT